MDGNFRFNFSIESIGIAIPSNYELNVNNSIFNSSDEAVKFVRTTGVEKRHISGQGQCSSDLMFDAVLNLFENGECAREDIQVMICATQTPDFHGPMNAQILQDRLGLEKSSICFDIPAGCSGFIVGLYTIIGLLNSFNLTCGLFVIGDTLSKQASPLDKSTQPLFGDGAAAIVIRRVKEDLSYYFNIGGDGSGYKSIYLPGGGYRNPTTIGSLSLVVDEIDSILRSQMHCVMRGMDVFSFGITVVPGLILDSLNKSNLSIEDIDYFVFHQANRFMLEKIIKKCQIPESKCLFSLEDFGNTSGASIPITIGSVLKSRERRDLRILACGFGVGLAWGVSIFTLPASIGLYLNYSDSL
jgi:3-oxoacyl-[acyl-carrier-protein] synthase-3